MHNHTITAFCYTPGLEGYIPIRVRHGSTVQGYGYKDGYPDTGTNIVLRLGTYHYQRLKVHTKFNRMYI